GRLSGVEDHRLPVPVHLAAAVRPQERVEPAVVVAKAVPQLEAEGMPPGFELRPGLEKLVPGPREAVHADFGEPVGPPYHELADVAEGERLPPAVDERRLLGALVPTAVLPADLRGDVAQVHVLLVVEVRPVEEVQRDVRS